MTISADRRGTPAPLPFYLAAAAMDLLRNTTGQSMSVTASDMAHGHSALQQMLAGIEQWQSADKIPAPPERDTIWQFGTARLLDVGGDGVPTLVIPSLINKSYILDLSPDLSFVNALKRQGLRPVLLDWGSPTDNPGNPDLSDHVNQILVPALHFLAGATGGPVNVLGYCMGGTLAIGLASQAQPMVKRLALIGAPWRFDGIPAMAQLRGQMAREQIAGFRQTLRQTGQTYGAIPADFFQLLFAILAPLQARDKFGRLAALSANDPTRRSFYAIENWINDCIPVAAAAAEELLVDWYVENATAQGRWMVAGRPVHLSEITCPALSISGTTDHIVPTGATPDLGRSTRNGADMTITSGHVGMVVGRAHADVAYRVCSFLTQKNLS